MTMLAALSACAPKPLLLTVTPSTAKVYGYSPRGDSTLLGQGGSASVIVKDEGTRVLITAEGYRPVSRVFTKADVQSGGLKFALTTWRFPINIDPFDADGRVDGVVQPRRSFVLEVERDKARTLEITKPGYRRIVKRYENLEGTQPPTIERFQLSDRAVLLTVAPAGTTIEVAGKPIGENAAEIAVPPGQCTAVRAVRPGFMPVEKQYCEGPAFAALPLTDKIELRDRMVAVSAEPATADIFVGGPEGRHRTSSTWRFRTGKPARRCASRRPPFPRSAGNTAIRTMHSPSRSTRWSSSGATRRGISRWRAIRRTSISPSRWVISVPPTTRGRRSARSSPTASTCSK
ncbi:hypothetical protein [Gemmatimonas sp.]|uniref:hypothetical protein n=1 Tax=Gemmatimonas sp. TaxID=1962908 RepID=UPI003DA2CF2E